ncbi:choline ABC transporter substrate-binding protein [Pseudomonas matsuisoli]|uniref:Glycine/betaine ABC transporter substrate-binding protein n=1 Tax=Pseudomonas matsuisoli TaxID=1515666 RepID=A0A917Q0E5_9PSED|nr:choline ABC transporter substrate-binding protein [Pseudomonas matsuisoli]GGK04199.1 glycine/betaine ABC transporter substrate-binding protein [Pseudomonas matsuisoli]
MKKMMTSCALSLLVAGNAIAAEPAACQKPRIGVVGWTDVVATTAISEVLLEGLGYAPKQTVASQQIVFAGMQKKQLDFFLGYWNPIMTETITPFLKSGDLEVLKVNLDGAVATLAVPRKAYDAGLKTFADIAQFKDKLDGKIYGIEPGTGANTGIQKMIDSNQFGLGDFKLMESSEAGMLAAVNRADRRGEWVVFFGWAPHPMNVQMDMEYLTGSEDALGANDGAATVETVVAKGYTDQCPNVGQLLNNLTFTIEQESRLMQPIMDRKNPKAVATQWLKEHPDDLGKWLSGVTTFDGKDGAAAVKAHLAK